MNDVIDLDLERLEREDDNTIVAPEDLLRLALKNGRNGEWGRGQPTSKAVAAIIMVVVEEADGVQTIEKYRCGLSRVQEIGYIELFKQQVMSRWLRSA